MPLEPFPPRRSRRLEALTLLLLVTLIVLSYRGWDPIEKIYRQTHNTLGQTESHMPTADLFLWTSFAIGLYFGTRMWAYLALHVFALSSANAKAWRDRLQLARLTTTAVFLCLVLLTLYRAGYNLF